MRFETNPRFIKFRQNMAAKNILVIEWKNGIYEGPAVLVYDKEMANKVDLMTVVGTKYEQHEGYGILLPRAS